MTEKLRRWDSISGISLLPFRSPGFNSCSWQLKFKPELHPIHVSLKVLIYLCSPTSGGVDSQWVRPLTVMEETWVPSLLLACQSPFSRKMSLFHSKISCDKDEFCILSPYYPSSDLIPHKAVFEQLFLKVLTNLDYRVL